MRWLGVALVLCAGCFDVPDASGCLRDCNDAATTCLQGASGCLDGCDDDRDCARGCYDFQIRCLQAVFNCAADCVQEVEEAL